MFEHSRSLGDQPLFRRYDLMQDINTPVLESQDFRLIPLRGKRGVGRFAKVSPHHYEMLIQYAWYVKGKPGNDYAARSVRRNGKQVYQRMHRDVLDAPSGMDVDHINGDRFDNRAENLRVATRSQNRANVRVRAQSKYSPYMGVILDKGCGKFKAHIGYNKKRVNLGVYESAEYAARVRDGAAIALYREFAVLQVPHLDPVPYIPRPTKVKTSKYEGVHFHKASRQWVALCSQLGKDYHIGLFDSEIDAAMARDQFARDNGIKVRRYNFPIQL